MTKLDQGRYDFYPILANGPQADFSPTFWGDKVVFSSAREYKSKNDKFTGQYYTTLFMLDTVSGQPSPLDLPAKFKYNSGAAVFSPSGDTIYFTCNRNKVDKNGVALLTIKSATRINGSWTEPFDLPFVLPRYNYAHPAISPDGRIMVYATDVDGSGMNLYYTIRSKLGRWDAPRPLKREINSPHNEVFPTFVGPTQLLFSSDGLSHGTGLDIYTVQYVKGKWSSPVLLDPPFNSSMDDYGLISQDGMQSGYFTSNRNNVEGNEDIYRFTTRKQPEVIAPQPEIVTVVPLIPVKCTTLDVKSKIAIPRAIITYMDTASLEEFVVKTDETGRASIDLLPDRTYTYTVSKSGYIFDANNRVSTQNIPEPIEIGLKRIEVNTIMILKDIYYDFDDWAITAASEIELERAYQFMIQNPTLLIELSSHTDSRGKDAYNMTLSHKRAQSVVDYLVARGIAADRLVPQGYGETKHVNRCSNGIKCTEDEHQQNRRTEIRVLKN
jgi:peptidoglycan-associated lipoprotein